MAKIKSRRSFLKGCGITGAAVYVAGAPPFVSPLQHSVIVVGAGAFGGWTALHLLRKGTKVMLIDAWGPGNSRASSGGETRIIRATYGPSRIYTQMAVRALQLWKENEQRWGLKLFFRTGVLWMAGKDDAYERAAVEVLQDGGVHFEKMTVNDCAKRWTQIKFKEVSWSIYEPDFGFLAARRGCEAVLNAFVKEGGEYRQAQATPGQVTANRMEGIVVNAGETLRADSYVFACGPWLGKVFPSLAPAITPTRQEVFFFGTAAGDLRFTEAQLPVWIDYGTRMYGIPGNHWRGFKVANDTRGPTVDPTTMERQVSATGLASARKYLGLRFPALGDAPLLEGRVCQYENSTDQNFILDRHPEAENIWIVGGGSGHGFKHGPALGELASDAVLGLHKPPREFLLGRLLSKSSN